MLTPPLCCAVLCCAVLCCAVLRCAAIHSGAGLLNPKKSTSKMFAALTDGNLQFAPLHDQYDIAVFPDKKYPMLAGAKRTKEALKKEFPKSADGIDKYFDLVFEADRSAKWYFVLKLLPLWLARILSPLLCKRFFEFADKTLADVLKPLVEPKCL